MSTVDQDNAMTLAERCEWNDRTYVGRSVIIYKGVMNTCICSLGQANTQQVSISVGVLES